MKVHILVLLACLMCLSVSTNARRKCRSPRRSCVLLSDCPGLQRKFNAGFKRIISQRICGREGRNVQVCCKRPRLFTTSTTTTTTVRSIPRRSSNDNLLPYSCGQAISSDRIYGGTEAPLMSLPWMALLGFIDRRYPSIDIWGCSGSLITNKYVLTAAHCVFPELTQGKTLTKIRLGEHNTNSEMDCERQPNGRRTCSPPVQDYEPAEIIPHPLFNLEQKLQNDIALIRLDREVQFQVHIQPLCLPPFGDTSDDLIGSQFVTVSGWGYVDHQNQSEVLRKVDLPNVNRSKCEANFVGRTDDLSQNCHGGIEGQDACFRDSGAPGIVTDGDNDNRYTQVSIVSYGKQCGEEGVPALYTNVVFFRDWIIDNLRS